MRIATDSRSKGGKVTGKNVIIARQEFRVVPALPSAKVSPMAVSPCFSS